MLLAQPSRGRTPRGRWRIQRRIDQPEASEDGSWPQPATVARSTIYFFEGSENTRGLFRCSQSSSLEFLSSC
jgi:hypothetical protein